MKLRAAYYGTQRICDMRLGSRRVLLAGRVFLAAYGSMWIAGIGFMRADPSNHTATVDGFGVDGGGVLVATGALQAAGRGNATFLGTGVMWTQVPARGAGEMLVTGLSTPHTDETVHGAATSGISLQQIANAFAAEPNLFVAEPEAPKNTAVMLLGEATAHCQTPKASATNPLLSFRQLAAALVAVPEAPKDAQILFREVMSGRTAASAVGIADDTICFDGLNVRAFAAEPEQPEIGAVWVMGSVKAHSPASDTSSARAILRVFPYADAHNPTSDAGAGTGEMFVLPCAESMSAHSAPAHGVSQASICGVVANDPLSASYPAACSQATAVGRSNGIVADTVRAIGAGATRVRSYAVAITIPVTPATEDSDFDTAIISDLDNLRIAEIDQMMMQI